MYTQKLINEASEKQLRETLLRVEQSLFDWQATVHDGMLNKNYTEGVNDVSESIYKIINKKLEQSE